MKICQRKWRGLLKILRNSRRALPQNGRLILIERIMPERVQTSALDQAAALADLNMLVQTGGAERTEAEYRTLLEKAGFRLERVIASGCSPQKYFARLETRIVVRDLEAT
jgi:hypothetical protein